jgi:hypothetical protein
MNDVSHNIDEAEKELIALAVKQLRDRCNQTLHWLYPPQKPVEVPPLEEVSNA